MKQCIICDRFLKDQKEIYTANHHLCGETCTKYYSYIAYFDTALKRFNVDEYSLNDIRRELIGINGIDQSEIDKRIDE